jgi:hypothetical protein
VRSHPQTRPTAAHDNSVTHGPSAGMLVSCAAVMLLGRTTFGEWTDR